MESGSWNQPQVSSIQPLKLASSLQHQVIMYNRLMKKHLAIFTPETIKLIFSGQKTVESRFSQKKIQPYGEVEVGDEVYLKPRGEEITGRFFVSKVIYFDGLDEEDWELIKQNYASKLALGTKAKEVDYFKSHQNARYGTIIYMDRVEQFITSPIKITKKDLRGWVVL